MNRQGEIIECLRDTVRFFREDLKAQRRGQPTDFDRSETVHLMTMYSAKLDNCIRQAMANP